MGRDKCGKNKYYSFTEFHYKRKERNGSRNKFGMGVGLLTRGEITAFLNVDGDPIKGDILMMYVLE